MRQRVTGDRLPGQLLGAQILGPWQAEVAKRVDIYAVDREGMAAAVLAELAAARRTRVTVLQADQYADLGSFTEVGAFVPLQRDRSGPVVREVAPARFALPLPDHPNERLAVGVALVRELRQQVPSPPTEATESRH